MSGSSFRPNKDAQEALGLPKEIKFFSAFPFGGINQHDDRTAIRDNQFYWLENFIRLGTGKLRTLWDAGPALFTVPSGATIVSHFWFNIGSSNYCMLFLADGTAIQYALETGLTKAVMAASAPFYAGSSLPATVQSGSQFLLIANNNTANSYWIWDGSVLYSAGTLGPTITLDSSGTGYTSAPTVTAYGGSGSGALFQAVISNGSVTAVQVVNPGSGYAPDDVVQLAFSGGGSDTDAVLAAVLTSTSVDHLNLLSGGSGYANGTYGLTITGGSGSGAGGTFTVSDGVVQTVSLASGGSGYKSLPSISFAGAGGTGAAAVAVLVGTSVASVTVLKGGSGYATTPTLSFSGGGGTGATATATVTSRAISSVSVGAGGTGYTSPPTVIVQSGQNSAASGTIDVMPFGVSGDAMETWQSRVWIAHPYQPIGVQNGGDALVSAPGSLTDFATADGGLLFVSSDRFLRAHYAGLRQSNGYLYFYGDSSVSIGSNVQTTGSTPTTTFNYQTTDPQVGVAWPKTLNDLGRTTIFANANGVFALYGGEIQKISNDINPFFDNTLLVNAAGLPRPNLSSSAVTYIHAHRCYFILMPVIDPVTQVAGRFLMGYDDETREWFAASQTPDINFIATLEISSTMIATGTDGTSLYKLFQQASSSLPKRIITKMYNANQSYLVKQAIALYLRATDLTATRDGIAADITVEASGIAPQSGQISELPTTSAPMPVQPDFQAPRNTYPVWGARTPDITGTSIGLTMTTTSADFILSDITMAYWDQAPIFG